MPTLQSLIEQEIKEFTNTRHRDGSRNFPDDMRIAMNRLALAVIAQLRLEEKENADWLPSKHQVLIQGYKEAVKDFNAKERELLNQEKV